MLYVLLDGLGDRPIKSLGDKTPLEAAYHPNLDEFAKIGVSGLVYTVGKGFAPESDVAVISMLGYDPLKTYTGRGPIEAIGAGIFMNDGDLAVRCNFATVDDEMNIIDRRCGRSLSTEEAKALAEAINNNLVLTSHPANFEFRSTIGHRGVLVIRSKFQLSDNITNTDPAYTRLHGLGVATEKFSNKVEICRPMDDSQEAKRAADLINEFTIKSHKILKNHPINIKRIKEGKPPANVILSRDAGSRIPRFQNIKEKYGREFACIVEMPVERGIALLCGMDVVSFNSIGDIREYYRKEADLVSELLEVYDVVYVHIKGPDEPAHDGDCEKKKKSIELIDEHFFGNLKLNLSNTIVAISSDHATPCALKVHSDDPVPIVISGGNIKSDGTKAFGERFCANGSLGIMNGQEVLRKAISFTTL